jgi:hypothetical protein
VWRLFHFVVRPAEVLSGVFCLITALLLYRDEEGRIQSVLEDFWITVDDYQKLALSRHAAFMQQVAKLETRFLDRIFGNKLVSLQSVVVSCCCSLMSAVLVLSIFLYADTINYLAWAWPFIVVLGALLVASTALIFIQEHHVARKAVLTITFVSMAAGLMSHEEDLVGAKDMGMFFVLIFVGGLVCDILFIVVTRRLVRWAGEMTRSLRVLAIIGLNLLLAVALIGCLFLFSPFSSVEPGVIGFVAVAVSTSNIFDALLAFLFVFLALILLVHRAVWPLLNRTLFRMQDIGTKGRRAILFAVGTGLLTLAGFGLPEWLKSIFKPFGG